jgi:rod shape-determining protein MreC
MRRDKRNVVGNKRFALFRQLKRRKIAQKVAICAAVIVILHLKITKEFVSQLRSGVTFLQVYVSRNVEKISNSFANLRYFMSANVDNILMELHNENLKLSQKINDLQNLKSENEQLRSLLSMRDLSLTSVIIAKVVTIFSNDFARSAVLDVGTSSGISMDDIVRNKDGLIGRIIEVHDAWSRVLMVTDVNLNVPIKINGINGIASGDNSNKLLITMIQEDIPIKNGDLVETSGYGNVFCEKIPIGTIRKEEETLYITPFVDFTSLKYVSVLKKK